MIGKLIVFIQQIRHAKRGLIHFGIYLTLAVALVACVSPASPSEAIPSELPPPQTEILVELATPSETLPPPPTTTLTPATETPTKTAIPLIEIKPLIGPEGLMLFDSWAPDSLWIAYWLAEAEENLASLVFVNVVSGETCQPEEVKAQSLGSDLLLWQEDGSVIVLPGGFPQGALKGVPCGAFVPVEDVTLPDPKTRTSLSPDGRYLAEEINLEQIEGTFQMELQIIEPATGGALLSMRYLGSPHLVSGGPRWLNNDTYVIGRTVDQGTIYYSVVEDRVGQLYPDLLRLETEKDFAFFTQTDPETGAFHILLLSDAPPLLYHSEYEELEELPFANVGNFAGASSRSSFFSPDGKWLLLSQVPGGHYWLRPVDPPGSPPTELAYYGQAGSLSRNGQSMAFFHGKRISIVSFPGGELLSQWHTSIYDIQTIWWSPDGKRLIAVGHQSATNQSAFFVIEP